MRKHYTQFSEGEYALLLSKVRSRNYTIGGHALDRMKQKHVNASQIRAMLSYCSIIEFHNEVIDDFRVLVRGKVQGAFVCAVLSLTRNEVVTTYWNGAGDNHKTLDISQYCWNVHISDVLQTFGI